MCEKKADEVKKKFQVLILFDLNGTLGFKSKQSIKDLKPDYISKNIKFYVRPGIEELLEELYKNTRVKIGFYSSMIKKNIIPILSAVYSKSKLLKAINSKNYLIFDRECCTVTPTEKDPYFSVKDLDKIRKSELFKKLEIHPRSIILIENELEKIKPESNTFSFCLKGLSYDEEAVIKKFPNSFYYHKSLFEYFSNFLDNYDYFDTYFNTNPFSCNSDELFKAETYIKIGKPILPPPQQESNLEKVNKGIEELKL